MTQIEQETFMNGAVTGAGDPARPADQDYDKQSAEDIARKLTGATRTADDRHLRAQAREPRDDHPQDRQAHRRRARVRL